MTLSELLDKLIMQLSTNEKPLSSIRSQADFLGVSVAQLSKLRNGKIPFTKNMVIIFSEKLAKTPEEREDIIRTLMNFTRASSDRSNIAILACRIQIEAKQNIGALL